MFLSGLCTIGMEKRLYFCQPEVGGPANVCFPARLNPYWGTCHDPRILETSPVGRSALMRDFLMPLEPFLLIIGIAHGLN